MCTVQTEGQDGAADARVVRRFVEGKHYFQISGNELENLRVSFSPSQISNKNAQPDTLD